MCGPWVPALHGLPVEAAQGGSRPFVCARLPSACLNLAPSFNRETPLPFVSPSTSPVPATAQHPRPLLYPQYAASHSGVRRETPVSYRPPAHSVSTPRACKRLPHCDRVTLSQHQHLRSPV